jgi:hypothetical protein
MGLVVEAGEILSNSTYQAWSYSSRVEYSFEGINDTNHAVPTVPRLLPYDKPIPYSRFESSKILTHMLTNYIPKIMSLYTILQVFLNLPNTKTFLSQLSLLKPTNCPTIHDTMGISLPKKQKMLFNSSQKNRRTAPIFGKTIPLYYPCYERLNLRGLSGYLQILSLDQTKSGFYFNKILNIHTTGHPSSQVNTFHPNK